MDQMKTYNNIDFKLTGLQIKRLLRKSGYSVKDIQEFLCLSCPQPIYRWMNGKILPSVDHLLMLSELFGVHMEELLVKKHKDNSSKEGLNTEEKFRNRIMLYCKMMSKMSA